MPDFTLRKQKILVDALQLLAEKKEFDEMEEAGNGHTRNSRSQKGRL